MEKNKVGLRYLVKCLKCGHEWLAQSEHPRYCARCHNPNPEQPRKNKRFGEL